MIQKILNLKKKKNKEFGSEHLGSIRNRIWKNFAIYIALILFAIWMMQNVFLDRFYTNMKIREIEEIGTSITKAYLEDRPFKEIIRQKSVESSTRIQVVDGEGNVIYPNDWMGIFYSTSYNKEIINTILSQIPKKEGAHILYDLGGFYTDNKSFLYLSYLGNKPGLADDLYLTIVSVVEPIDSTIKIMEKQFPYIILIVFMIGIVISYFMSKRLSFPIRKLNEAAQKIATRADNVEFPESDVYEINELSKTLNYATEELAKMDEMRISVVANVSHDLKTPLTVIKSYAEMIRDISGDDKNMREKHLDVIVSEADRLTGMVNEILDVSKLEMQMQELNCVEFSLKKLTEDIIKRLEVFSKTENYIFSIEGNSKGIINADPYMIDKVIYNFATNAVSFAGDDKKIIFRIEEDDEKIVYSVIDHGKGIEDSEKEKIWERYYTDHQNHVRNVVGTGLGLHIVRVILEKHGFEYGVESKIDNGSKFYFIVKK